MSESIPYVFRTAVGGFHKGDVSAYIAKTAAEHQAQLESMKSQNDELERQLGALRLENDSLRRQLQTDAVEAKEKITEPEVPAEEVSLQDKELAAYRRAEAAERLACQRAKKLYQDMQRICGDSARQLAQTDATAQQALEQIRDQFGLIRDSVSALYETVRDASQELREMGQMVPDPAEGLEEN